MPPPDPETLRERLDRIEARYLWVLYHNFGSMAQAKCVPRARFSEVATGGVSFAKANWDFLVDDQQVPDPGYGADTGDFVVLPDPGTLVKVPYRDGVAQTYGWLMENGRPWSGDPRARLRDAVDALDDRGLTAQVAFEAEFVLASPTDAGSWQPADQGRMFTVDEIDARWSWCRRVLDSLEEMGIPVHQFAKEYGPGQYEISLLPADPVTACDRFLLVRQAVKALARDVGLVATFMPKPWTDRPGNGLHLHLSLWRRDGSSALDDPAAPEGLSAVASGSIAALLRHAEAQAALCAPTPNSYKRLQPGSWAPAHVCWGHGNRAALIRIPARAPSSRLEYRMGDATANPYLHLTGLLAGVFEGLDGAGTLPPAALVDVGHLDDQDAAARGFPRLPRSLDVSLAALGGDELLRAALGPAIVDHYLSLKRFELDTYRRHADPAALTTEVSEWERTVYLEPI